MAACRCGSHVHPLKSSFFNCTIHLTVTLPGPAVSDHSLKTRPTSHLAWRQATNLTELLNSGLRNDSEAETFELTHETRGVVFPVQFIKVRTCACAVRKTCL